MNGNEYLKLSDLKVGDRVNTHQLSKIYNTYILLSNTKLVGDGSTEGTIEFIGAEQNEEMLDILNMCKQRDGKRPMIYAHKNIQNGIYSL